MAVLWGSHFFLSVETNRNIEPKCNKMNTNLFISNIEF